MYHHCRVWPAGLACLVWLLAAVPVPAITNYFTRFEVAEGYDPVYELNGQGGWSAEGTGGNGLLTNIFSGENQHAYVGFYPPLDTDEDQLFVWQPINFNPLSAGLPIVKFSTLMQIVDSSEANGEYDVFRWSIYNRQIERLLSIEFDNYWLEVNYVPAGTNIHYSGIPLTNGLTYELVVTMNFASNRWSATLNGLTIATNQFLSTNGAQLNLGDIDAVWLINNPLFPGDNFMVFDNYRITAEAMNATTPPPPPAQLTFLGRTITGQPWLQVAGQEGSRWSVDATTNFTHWTALKTNPISGGSFDYVDTTATGLPRRHYRARWVP